MQPRQESDTDTKTGSFTLAHRLYDSVRTFYSMNRSSSQTSSGDSNTLTNSLNGMYTKRVPTGRLTVGVQASRSKVDRENAPLILLESYNAALFRSFTITRDGIDPNTVSFGDCKKRFACLDRMAFAGDGRQGRHPRTVDDSGGSAGRTRHDGYRSQSCIAE